jgi:hypothetical protein
MNKVHPKFNGDRTCLNRFMMISIPVLDRPDKPY